jgi:tetratricopeptide (TPR) repeat protein
VILGAALAVPVAAAHAAPDHDLAQDALGAWDLRASGPAIERLWKSHPDDPKTWALAGHQALLQSRYKEAAELLGRAVARDAGPEVAHYLAIASSTAKVTEGYQTHRTAGGHFILAHAPGSDAVLVPYAEETLETAYSELTRMFDFAPEEPVRVEIYPEAETLGAVSPLSVEEIRTSGTIALCKYNRLMIVSPRDLVYGYGWADTLAHEYIHLLITKKSRNTVPIWLHEGLAKYYEQRWKPGSVPELGRTSEDLLARAVKADALVSFEAMSPSIAKLPSQEAAATAFAEVFTVIELLVSRQGDAVAARLPALMRAGKTDREAVAELAGVPWERFEPSWRAYLKGRGLRTLPQRFADPLVFRGDDSAREELEAIEAKKARQHVWLGDRLRLKARPAAALEEYRKAQRPAGDRHPAIQAKLGWALLELGRIGEAIVELRRPLPLYPEYVLLHLYLGRAHHARKELDQAREHFEKTLHVNPFDPDVHQHLGRIYAELGLPERAARERAAQRLLDANP